MRVTETQFKGNPRLGYTFRFAKRVDRNQPDIVKTLRQLGFMVHHLHEVGDGMYDLIISKHGMNILAEVKDGQKPPSARELTPKQKKFNFSWSGMRCVLTCGADCVSLNEQINSIARQLRFHNIDLTVTGSKESQYQPRLYA